MESGDNQTALAELNAAIAISPDVWSYYRRARLNAELGNEKAAADDCKLGLGVDPNDEQLKWLTEELRKPVSQRFKGKTDQAPVDK